MTKRDLLVNKITELVKPVVIDSGYEFYHIEFVKEDGENFLRIYIDNEKGIGLEDCEKVSRKISDILDVEDPISDSYYLEVSSPGIERVLHTDEHLKRYIGSKVIIKLHKLFSGKKKMSGILIFFNDLEVKIQEEGNEIIIPRDRIKTITLNGDI
ncbi:ribosome maturation factor RimP [Haloimpatiens sp. FM7315]|uniref:ribosome maturation factor RimP n=1 Tax=Haloimpatiens sp. FM7315 TaxID=3298609 RepID=UPI00370CC84D